MQERPVPSPEPAVGPPRRWPLRRLVRIAVGLLLLLGGLAGLVLPFLQGVLMILAALAILRKEIPLVDRFWQRGLLPLWRRWLAPYWQRLHAWLRRQPLGRRFLRG